MSFIPLTQDPLWDSIDLDEIERKAKEQQQRQQQQPQRPNIPPAKAHQPMHSPVIVRSPQSLATTLPSQLPTIPSPRPTASGTRPIGNESTPTSTTQRPHHTTTGQTSKQLGVQQWTRTTNTPPQLQPMNTNRPPQSAASTVATQRPHATHAPASASTSASRPTSALAQPPTPPQPVGWQAMAAAAANPTTIQGIQSHTSVTSSTAVQQNRTPYNIAPSAHQPTRPIPPHPPPETTTGTFRAPPPQPANSNPNSFAVVQPQKVQTLPRPQMQTPQQTQVQSNPFSTSHPLHTVAPPSNIWSHARSNAPPAAASSPSLSSASTSFAAAKPMVISQSTRPASAAFTAMPPPTTTQMRTGPSSSTGSMTSSSFVPTFGTPTPPAPQQQQSTNIWQHARTQQQTPPRTTLGAAAASSSTSSSSYSSRGGPPAASSSSYHSGAPAFIPANAPNSASHKRPGPSSVNVPQPSSPEPAKEPRSEEELIPIVNRWYEKHERNKMNLIDADKIGNYLYPSPSQLPFCNYQHDISWTCLRHNALVCLPASTGKSLIAAVVMYNFYRWFPQGKVLFLAPAKPLVVQQQKACATIMGIPSEHMATLISGGSQDSLDRKAVWQSDLTRILFATPQSMSSHLSDRIVPLQKVVCIIIDEVHKTTVTNAYMEVVKAVSASGHPCRIIGFSATLGKSVWDLKQLTNSLKSQRIELRLDTDPDLSPHLKPITMEKRVVRMTDTSSDIKQALNDCLQIPLGNLVQLGVAFGNRDASTTTTKSLTNAMRTFSTSPEYAKTDKQKQMSVLGYFGVCIKFTKARELANPTELMKFLEEHLVGDDLGMVVDTKNPAQRKRPTAALLNLRDSVAFKKLVQLVSSKLDDANNDGEADSTFMTDINPDGLVGIIATEEYQRQLNRVRRQQPKLAEVVDLITCNLQEHEQKEASAVPDEDPMSDGSDDEDDSINVTKGFYGSASQTNIIVLVDKREQVDEILPVLQQFGELCGIRPARFLGQGKKGMSQKEQSKVLDQFRDGDFNVLIATCAADEGLDIGNVDLVISYDPFRSSTRVTQRKGRVGRKREAKNITLVYEGKEEESYDAALRDRNKLVNDLAKEGCHPAFLQPAAHNQMIPDEIIPAQTLVSMVASTPASKTRARASKATKPAATSAIASNPQADVEMKPCDDDNVSELSLDPSEVDRKKRKLNDETSMHLASLLNDGGIPSDTSTRTATPDVAPVDGRTDFRKNLDATVATFEQHGKPVPSTPTTLPSMFKHPAAQPHSSEKLQQRRHAVFPPPRQYTYDELFPPMHLTLLAALPTPFMKSLALMLPPIGMFEPEDLMKRHLALQRRYGPNASKRRESTDTKHIAPAPSSSLPTSLPVDARMEDVNVHESTALPPQPKHEEPQPEVGMEDEPLQPMDRNDADHTFANESDDAPVPSDSDVYACLSCGLPCTDEVHPCTACQGPHMVCSECRQKNGQICEVCTNAFADAWEADAPHVDLTEEDEVNKGRQQQTINMQMDQSVIQPTPTDTSESSRASNPAKVEMVPHVPVPTAPSGVTLPAPTAAPSTESISSVPAHPSVVPIVPDLPTVPAPLPIVFDDCEDDDFLCDPTPLANHTLPSTPQVTTYAPSSSQQLIPDTQTSSLRGETINEFKSAAIFVPTHATWNPQHTNQMRDAAMPTINSYQPHRPSLQFSGSTLPPFAATVPRVATCGLNPSTPLIPTIPLPPTHADDDADDDDMPISVRDVLLTQRATTTMIDLTDETD